MKYIKTYEILEQEVTPDTIYKYAIGGFVAIGKLRKKDYNLRFYNYIDNGDDYQNYPWNTNYKIKPNREITITELDAPRIGFATPREIDTYNTITNINKYNL